MTKLGNMQAPFLEIAVYLKWTPYSSSFHNDVLYHTLEHAFAVFGKCLIAICLITGFWTLNLLSSFMTLNTIPTTMTKTCWRRARSERRLLMSGVRNPHINYAALHYAKLDTYHEVHSGHRQPKCLRSKPTHAR